MKAGLATSGTPHSIFDAFISYGRADSKAFALLLCEQLTAAGYNVWFDFNDIPLAVDYQEQINSGIEHAKNFLFVIAPHSVNSPYCGLEVALALKCNKRIIPLLHVEQITYEIWQQRNPNGTDEQWKDYQSKGLHSSFPNMHPAISKINWVYFREGIDDFAAAVTGLSSALERHDDYVHQHTVLLAKALYWQRHQCKTQNLLTGRELELAEIWLKTRFKGEQAPCFPTELHGEFITESIKNDQNLMTQVFLSYADEDREMMKKIRNSLRYEGITVWSNKTDIRIGEDFVSAIRRGIEQSDNLVYLISPDSLQSQYCQIEIEYAYQLNKRIIPVLLRPVKPTQIPAILKDLQYVDLSNLENDDDYRIHEHQLLNTLQQNANYHRQHKLLLAKALKWQQQYDNPSLLLQGNNLRQAEAWLKEAVHHPQFAPLPLHQEFIEKSQQQPPDQTFNVFICYSSLDIEFIRKLNDNLQLQGMKTWFDQENLEGGQDSQHAVQQGIDNSENFLFVISPHSIQSPVCLEQLAYAAASNKRQVTVLYQDVSIDELPATLSNIQWIDFRDHQDDLLKSFGELIRILSIDPKYVKLHTRLLVKAKEWAQADRDDDLLLHGKQLQTVVRWLATTATQAPKPTELQREYVKASQDLPFRKIKLRSMLLTSLAAALLVAIARVFGVLQPLELKTYDTLLKFRPSEPSDARILIVKVDGSSGVLLRERMIDGAYQPSIGTIPDAALNDALKILESHQPRLIGLDFYRDFPTESVLKDQFTTSHIISNCLSSGRDYRGNVTAGVPNLTGTAPENIGFANILADGPDRFVRRHYLMQEADPTVCDTSQSFSVLLVRNYLKVLGKTFTSPVDPGSDGIIRFGKTSIPLLDGNGSGYSPLERSLGGYQSMLNYRVSDRPPGCIAQPFAEAKNHRLENFAATVTLADVLQYKVAPECIRDRIVLIGYTDTTDRNADVWMSPYGRVAGVLLQGQMVSQLLSAVLDGRSLIWWMPLEGEALWILVAALGGGLVFWQIVRPARLLFAAIAVLVVLVSSCYVILVTTSGWIPLIPAAIGFGVAGSGVAYLSHRIRNPW